MQDLPDGRVSLLGPRDASPFAPVDIPVDRPVTALANNLFTAPMGHQRPIHTDFLLVRTKLPDGTFDKQIVLRAVQALYTVGSLVPKMEIPEPKEALDKELCNKRVQAFLLRQLQDGGNAKLTHGAIRAAFTNQDHKRLALNVKSTAEQVANEDGEEIYRLKPGVGKSEAEIRTLLTPEQVSASQSMHQTWTALQHDGPNHLGLW